MPASAWYVLWRWTIQSPALSASSTMLQGLHRCHENGVLAQARRQGEGVPVQVQGWVIIDILTALSRRRCPAPTVKGCCGRMGRRLDHLHRWGSIEPCRVRPTSASGSGWAAGTTPPGAVVSRSAPGRSRRIELRAGGPFGATAVREGRTCGRSREIFTTSRGGGVDHLAAADVETDVEARRAGAVEDEVTGAQVRDGDTLRLVPLGPGVVAGYTPACRHAIIVRPER